MAEVLVSAIVTVLIEKLAGELMNFAQSQGIDSQLKKWKTTLLIIQAVLADAAQKQIQDEAVEMWLNELQDLAYDIEDVLDDIATEAMKRNLQESNIKVLKMIPSPHNIMYGRKMSSNLKKITTRLHDLSEQRNVLGLNVNRETSTRIYKRLEETTSLLPDVSEIFGREGDKEAMLGKLLGDEGGASSNQNVISVVSIVGMGGIGKTTLARLLYNDPKVEDHFELRAWVCVSNEFDVFNISKQIYQAVVGEDKTFTSLNLLHVALSKELSKKRFLLVLDDVWNDDQHKWEALKRPLKGEAGSKVIVTTRNTVVASVMNSVPSHYLGILKEEIALSLFALYALEEKNFDKHPSLSTIARGIVRKCGGLPLALVTIGRVLKTKGNDVVQWEELLNSEIWSSDDRSGILPALKLSYYHLPSHLKQPFAYCSLYPKDHQFDKKKLVLKWMAQGFLSQTSGGKSMEIFGHEYFEELRLRCFFQPSTINQSRYTMHDLMNDLAKSVAGKFFFVLDDKVDTNGQNEDFEKFRHFSFIGKRDAEYRKLKELHRARCIRTFLPIGDWENFKRLNNVPFELLTRLQFLRVLSLTDTSITEVAQSIGNLKHLRYLNFSSTSIKDLPKDVGKLYNLQTLLVRDCCNLSSLPISLVRLKNLRHLDMAGSPQMKTPLWIGGLTSLQTLPKVCIEGGDGFKISVLKGLPHLQGALSIKGLEKVMDPTEAKDADLKEKKGLDDLELVWDDAATNEDDVIEKLRPHSKLKTLHIDGYGGIKFPSWLGDPSFDRLTQLTIGNCKNCTHLPALGYLTSLRKFKIQNCPNLVSIKGEKRLVNVGGSFMGSLREVTLLGCQSLESYCCPNKVEKLVIENCDSMTSLTFSKLQEDCPSSSSSFNLEILAVSHCKNLKSIGEKEVVNVGSSIMRSLRKVTLHYCDSLESYCCPTSVERLEIWNCNSITSLTFSKLQEEDLPSSSSFSSLKILHVICCKNIKSISQEHLQSLTSVEVMWIYKCPSIEYSFPSRGSLWSPILKYLATGELKKPMSEWGIQNYPPSLVQLVLLGRNSRVVSFGIEVQDHNNTTTSACFLLPSSLTELTIYDFEEVESVSEVLQYLPHLQRLEIYSCPKLRDVPESTSSLTVKNESQLTSRRLGVAYLASSMALISNSATSHIKADALAPEFKERPMCRNCDMCGGTGKWKALNRKRAKRYRFTQQQKVFLGGLMPSNCLIRCIIDDYFQTHKVQFGSRVLRDCGI